jgi:hypothetical protein
MNNIHSSLAFHSTTALRFPAIASIVRLAPSFAFSFIFSFLQAKSIAQPASGSRKKYISSFRLTRKALYAILHDAMTETRTNLPLLHGLLPLGICHRTCRGGAFLEHCI